MTITSQPEFTESPRRNPHWEDTLSWLLPSAEDLWNRILAAGGTDGQDQLDASTYTIAGLLEGDGNSTITAALGYYLAQSLGLRVLMVEADLRAPSMEYDGIVPESPGLVGLLQREVDARDAVLELTRVGFCVLPAGDPPLNPSMLITHKNIEGLVQTLQPFFEVILFDSAPLSTAPEARHLVHLSDATIPVMASGRVLPEDAAHWIDLIHEYGGRIGAVCMNDVRSPLPTWLRGMF